MRKSGRQQSEYSAHTPYRASRSTMCYLRPISSVAGRDAHGIGPAPKEDEDAQHFSGPYERRVLGVSRTIYPRRRRREKLRALGSVAT